MLRNCVLGQDLPTLLESQEMARNVQSQSRGKEESEERSRGHVGNILSGFIARPAPPVIVPFWRAAAWELAVPSAADGALTRARCSWGLES